MQEQHYYNHEKKKINVALYNCPSCNSKKNNKQPINRAHFRIWKYHNDQKQLFQSVNWKAWKTLYVNWQMKWVEQNMQVIC